MMKNYFYFFAVLLLCFSAQGQPSANRQIPLARLYFHELIDSTQKKLLQSDKINDDYFTPTSNEELNHELTIAATETIDNFQKEVEKDSSLDNNSKIKFLRGMNEMLMVYMRGVQYDSIQYSALPQLLHAFSDNMQLEKNNESIAANIESYPYEVGTILINNLAFKSNSGYNDSRIYLLLKYCDKYKQKALGILQKEPTLPFTDSLIKVIARNDPDNLYIYAAAPDALAQKIRSSDDKLTSIIGQMATMKTGRQFFPFLDNLYREKINFEQIQSVMNDSVKYYKLLVQTQIDYAGRLLIHDTPMAMQSLTAKLQKKAVDPFINTINGLHDVSDERIRFKIIEPFGPQDLYYMAVLGEEVIYTSSYVKGVYPRIWKNAKSAKSDSLLMSVRFDHFKKWIKMASNYNTLDDFLKRMDKQNAQLLMKAFVNGLDKTESLEDAVDVANSYASITDKEVQKLILSQVQSNLQQAIANNNKRGADIYSILNTLFTSMDTSAKIDVSKELGIPPVYYMPNKDLRDTSGRIVVQQFFYGDKDGQTVFNGFVNSFSNSNWKITGTKEWVSISSANGVPVTIYANRPLDEKQSLDTKAQRDLGDYMYNNDISPTVVIHRGHSYWLPSTIDQLVPTEKVVLLGSCGAYQSLSKILKICPAAQIVASKQTGSGLVNHPMIYTILNELRKGNDLNWPQLWKTLSQTLGNNELFDDYVPPHKNLGALFLMAYDKKQQVTN
ncbi:MAG TPA: hypothetical protein PL045_03420 [Chitinophagaceae bacterium]|nr:hypothetical protein [Chitinophagaceae bacterium]